MQTLILLLAGLFLPLLDELPPVPPIVMNVTAAEPGKIVVSAHDGTGKTLSGITAGQFSVREDDGADLKATQLDQFIDPGAKAGLVVVVDVSGSMAGQPLEDARQAVTRLVQALGPEDKVALIAFASDAGLAGLFSGDATSNFTVPADQVEEFMAKLRAGGNTALYDAVYKGVRAAAVLPETDRAVVLVTDGRDETLRRGAGTGSSIANADSAIFEALRNRIPIFTVGVGNRKDESYLKRLALLTGGAYVDAPTQEQLSLLFENILDRLKMRYRVAYESQVPQDGAPHRVRVALRVGDEVAAAESVISAAGVISNVQPVEEVPGWEPLPLPTPAALGPGATATPAAAGVVSGTQIGVLVDTPPLSTLTEVVTSSVAVTATTTTTTATTPTAELTGTATVTAVIGPAGDVTPTASIDLTATPEPATTTAVTETPAASDTASPGTDETPTPAISAGVGTAEPAQPAQTQPQSDALAVLVIVAAGAAIVGGGAYMIARGKKPPAPPPTPPEAGGSAGA